MIAICSSKHFVIGRGRDLIAIARIGVRSSPGRIRGTAA
jgi:hypothetical protein